MEHTEHPSRGSDGITTASFRRCNADRRCGVCRLLDGQKRRERALFRAIISQEGVGAELDRLSQLFYDAKPPVAKPAAAERAAS